MKTRICLLSLITAVLLGTTTFADGPFDKFLPRGRLLKKLRDDFVGQPTPKQPTPAKKPTQANQKGPTPATRHASQQRPTTGQQRPATSKQADVKRPMGVRSGADGFGMTVVVDKNENFVVAQVLANGNAAEAGIQRGDLVVEAGGVELTAIEEFQQIAKVLGAGDQLELKIARRGKTDTVMLQHGQPPSLDDLDSANAQTGATDRSRSRQPTSSARAGYQDEFSFVPPADDDSLPGMQSVIEQSKAPVRRVSSQKPALSQLQSNYRPGPSQLQPQATQQQQQQIQALRQQLEQLRRQQSLTGSGVRGQ